MQVVLWQVVDITLKDIRKQFFAELEAFWDARNIYQAQFQAHQVPTIFAWTQPSPGPVPALCHDDNAHDHS